MSARTPFVPSGTRQEPRVNGDQQEMDSLSKPDSVAINNENDSTKAPFCGNVEDLYNNKPLNVNGLIRTRARSKPQEGSTNQQQSIFRKSSLSEHHILRSSTTEPHHDSEQHHQHAHIPNIVAPKPFKASRLTPSLLLNVPNGDVPSDSLSPYAFKTPALPAVHTPEEVFSNNAHIPTDSHASPHGGDLSSNSHMRTLHNVAGDRSLSVHLTPRIMVDKNGQAMNGIGVQQQQPIDNQVGKMSAVDTTANGSHRRRRNEVHENSGGRVAENGYPVKRFKVDGKGPRRFSSVDKANQTNQGYAANVGTEYQSWSYPESHSQKTLAEAPRTHPYSSSETLNVMQQDLTPHLGALDRILGRDVNAYTEERLIERYEHAAARWRDCTYEEWLAGAEEIKDNFAKILDFVKDHMSAKIDLFASFDKKLEEHDHLLAQREEKLSVVRSRLVKESESVLGRSLGMLPSNLTTGTATMD